MAPPGPGLSPQGPPPPTAHRPPQGGPGAGHRIAEDLPAARGRAGQHHALALQLPEHRAQHHGAGPAPNAPGGGSGGPYIAAGKATPTAPLGSQSAGGPRTRRHHSGTAARTRPRPRPCGQSARGAEPWHAQDPPCLSTSGHAHRARRQSASEKGGSHAHRPGSHTTRSTAQATPIPPPPLLSINTGVHAHQPRRQSTRGAELRPRPEFQLSISSRPSRQSARKAECGHAHKACCHRRSTAQATPILPAVCQPQSPAPGHAQKPPANQRQRSPIATPTTPQPGNQKARPSPAYSPCCLSTP